VPGAVPASCRDVREAARQYTPQALKTLINVMENPKAPSSARVQAASVLLDRGWGKAPVMEPIAERQELIVRWIGEGDDDAGVTGAF
jgi:hypothetical protein